MSAAQRVGVGCDLVAVVDVERSVARWGRRYLSRIYRDGEVDDCGVPASADRLAARFAAKEAVVKALRLGARTGPWTEVEIRRTPDGGLGVVLHGVTAEAATAVGGEPPIIDVSVTHDAGFAMAVAVAVAVRP